VQAFTKKSESEQKQRWNFGDICFKSIKGALVVDLLSLTVLPRLLLTLTLMINNIKIKGPGGGAKKRLQDALGPPELPKSSDTWPPKLPKSSDRGA